jgi:hypothetical protein
MKRITEMKWDYPLDSLKNGEALFDPRPGYEIAEKVRIAGAEEMERAIAAGGIKDPDSVREKFERLGPIYRTKMECRCVLRRFLESPTIYDIDPALHDLLGNAKWKPNILSEFIRLPKGHCIGLSMPKGAFLDNNDELVDDCSGLFLVVDEGAIWGAPEAPRALVIAMAPLGIPVAVLPLVEGEPLGEAFDARKNVDRGMDAGLRARGEEVPEEPAEGDGLRSFSIRYAINVLLYLLGDPDTVAEIHPGVPPTKKNRNKPDFARRPSTVVHVGKILGDKIRAMERYAEQDQASEKGIGTGRQVRAHLRSAHFHTYLVGKGRTDVRVRLVATILVNGKEQTLDEILQGGDEVRVK